MAAVIRTSTTVPTTGAGWVRFLLTTALVMAAVYRIAPVKAFVIGTQMPTLPPKKVPTVS